MEPTQDDLDTFNTFEASYTWAGLSPTEVAPILAALGNPTTFREVGAIPADVYSSAMNDIRVPVPPGEDSAPMAPRLKGLAQVFRNACLAKCSTPGLTSASAPLAVHKVHTKMSILVDSTIDSEVLALAKGTVEKLFSDYRASRGEFPSPEIEPTEDQLSAVSQLLKTGVAPYVDFAIFGPFGRRLLRKLTFISYQYNAPEGSWKRLELPGPPDFDSWWKSWLVFKCTLLLLDAVRPERLDHYGEHIRSFLATYGTECWFIIYQADVRMRSEQFERIRRRLQIDFDANLAPHGFLPAKPWDGVFAASVKDKEFWDTEVRERALLYLTKAVSFREASHDGTTQYSRGPPQSGKGHHGQGQKRKAQQHPRSDPGPKGKSSKPPGGKGSSKHMDPCNN
jgi:hypothetical protein